MRVGQRDVSVGPLDIGLRLRLDFDDTDADADGKRTARTKSDEEVDRNERITTTEER